ncbi:unnamed protein product [Angiostrongylus costaricensis]|uniref:DnaJ homolog subfamily C member 2 n=1 Tax=Angiostrongylus costaricensis TaxID=334426 RepID=A0A0R3PAC4_ANGCS|nr:unnamed protein product [Angiostrongylus costaricensis]
MRCIVVAFFLLDASGYASPSWSSDELAMYDLVEAVNANFYELFGIGQLQLVLRISRQKRKKYQDASTAEVKKAYRKLSLEWHPDRNDAPNATAMFRQGKIRQRLEIWFARLETTNLLLQNPCLLIGFRKMRKLSCYEAVLVLTIVSTVAHYFMMWASYYEKYLVLSQTLRKSRRRDKREENEGSSQQLREALSIYRPQFRALLPFLVVKELWRFFTMLQMVIQEHMSAVEPVQEQNMHENRRVTPVVRSPEFTYEMATDLKAVSPNDPGLCAKYRNESEENSKKQSGDIWSCEELYQLWIILGTPNRWERVACVLNRTAQDVTAMAAKLKQIKQEDFAKLAMGQQSNAVFDIRNGKSLEFSFADRSRLPVNQLTTEWSQTEQKQLEAALQQYPKGCDNRWDRISAAVPTKSKEQCQERLKELVEFVRRKKARMT